MKATPEIISGGKASFCRESETGFARPAAARWQLQQILSQSFFKFLLVGLSVYTSATSDVSLDLLVREPFEAITSSLSRSRNFTILRNNCVAETALKWPASPALPSRPDTPDPGCCGIASQPEKQRYRKSKCKMCFFSLILKAK